MLLFLSRFLRKPRLIGRLRCVHVPWVDFSSERVGGGTHISIHSRQIKEEVGETGLGKLLLQT